jgi:hypothetical protein
MQILRFRFFSSLLFIITFAWFSPAYAVQPKSNLKNMNPVPQIISFIEADKRFQLSKIDFSFEASRLQEAVKKSHSF